VIAGPAGPVQWAVNGRFLSEPFSGVQRAATGFLRALASDPRYVLLCPTGHRPSWWDGAVREARVPPGRPGRSLWEQLAAPALARRTPVLSLANTAPLLCRDAVVVYDVTFLAHPEWFRPSFRRTYGAITARAAKGGRRVIVPSAFTASELVARLDVPFERITIVRPGIDARFAPPGPAAEERVRSRYGISGAFLLAVGTVDPRKGFDVAARVAADVGLPLVAAGASDPTFVGAAHSPGVQWLGRVPDADLPALYAASTALLYPSRYEGYGLPPLEAMACGAVVVASDIPPLRETLSGAAVLVPPDDAEAWANAVRGIIDGAEVGVELRAAGVARAATFSWARAADGLRAVLAT
jgi:glycosyltransferase involved in cell wall biosynthesis